MIRAGFQYTDPVAMKAPIGVNNSNQIPYSPSSHNQKSSSYFAANQCDEKPTEHDLQLGISPKTFMNNSRVNNSKSLDITYVLRKTTAEFLLPTELLKLSLCSRSLNTFISQYEIPGNLIEIFLSNFKFTDKLWNSPYVQINRPDSPPKRVFEDQRILKTFKKISGIKYSKNLTLNEFHKMCKLFLGNEKSQSMDMFINKANDLHYAVNNHTDDMDEAERGIFRIVIIDILITIIIGIYAVLNDDKKSKESSHFIFLAPILLTISYGKLYFNNKKCEKMLNKFLITLNKYNTKHFKNMLDYRYLKGYSKKSLEQFIRQRIVFAEYIKVERQNRLNRALIAKAKTLKEARFLQSMRK